MNIVNDLWPINKFCNFVADLNYNNEIFGMLINLQKNIMMCITHITI